MHLLGFFSNFESAEINQVKLKLRYPVKSMPNLIGGMPVVYSAAASARIKQTSVCPANLLDFFLIDEINQVKLKKSNRRGLPGESRP